MSSTFSSKVLIFHTLFTLCKKYILTWGTTPFVTVYKVWLYFFVCLGHFWSWKVLLWFLNIFIANILKRNQVVFSWYHFFVHSNFWHILFGVKITHFSLLQEIFRILISLKPLRMFYLNDKTINFITILVVNPSLVILSWYHFSNNELKSHMFWYFYGIKMILPDFVCIFFWEVSTSKTSYFLFKIHNRQYFKFDVEKFHGHLFGGIDLLGSFFLFLQLKFKNIKFGAWFRI